jgi:putative DNA primase/helicase
MMLAMHPDGQLAVRTGEKSKIFVIDAEGGEGEEVLDSWESWADSTTLPRTLTARTPSGGVHLFYEYQTGVKSRNRILPSVDLKSDGGYVALPCGIDGRMWLPGITQPATAQPALVDWLRTARGRSNGGGAGTTGHASGYDYQTFVRDGCPGGHRDEFFNDMVFRLRKAAVSREDAELELRKHWENAEQPPSARYHMPWEHVLYKLERVWRTVDADPPVPGWRPPNPGNIEVAELGEPDPELPNDLGNAHRFIRMHGSDIRFITETRQWLLWNGTRWVNDKLDQVHHLATKIGDDIRRQADALQNEDERRALGRWAMQTESLRGMNSAVAIAGRDPRIAMPVDAVDRNPLLLVVRNGVLNLRTLDLEEGRREDNCTRMANVVFNKDADCPRWMEHVKFITLGDAILASYLRRAIGYTLTGMVSEQTFFMLEGSGSNGKNAFIDPIRDLLGEYAQQGTSALITGGDEQHPTILADLIGCRMVFIDEARQGRPLNVERVKQLTGSKRIKARRMSRDFFEFDAHLKLWIAGNNHPTMRDPSDGIWRRLQRVIFRAKVPNSKKIPDFAQLLFDEEAPGILNWALEGLRDFWQLNGLGQPQEVVDATQEVRDEEDWVGQFLEEKCSRSNSADDFTTVDELYLEFSWWANLVGVKAYEKPNRTHFGRDLSNRGLERAVKNNRRGYRGIRLTERSITGNA